MTIDAMESIKHRWDLLFDELKVLQSIENWATTLFLGAIGLVTKQIVDWGNPAMSASCKALVLDSSIFLLPAAIGLVAFFYQRCLNFRIRDVRRRLYKFEPDNKDSRPWSLGAVGWLMALMPLAFGYVASWKLAANNPVAKDIPSSMEWLAFVILSVAIAAFVYQERHRNDSVSLAPTGKTSK